MDGPYKISEQDGKWQVLIKEPPQGITPSGWITCQTKADADAIADGPVLDYAVDKLGKRGEDRANRLDLASKAVELSMVGDEMIGTCPLSRHYSALAEEARGTEVE